jgi:endonuclease YncB( thermonuclease family)
MKYLSVASHIIMLLGSSSLVMAEPAQVLPDSGFTVHGHISEVVTGADVVVEGKLIHLEGLRAPNRGRVCIRGGESVDVGREAAEGLSRKLNGGEAFIEAHTDGSGRLVGGGMVNGSDIGEIATSNGFAVSKIGFYTYAKQEREARTNRLGLWSCSSFPKQETPTDIATSPAPPASEPMQITPKPTPQPPSRAGVEYAPEDVQIPYQPVEPEDDLDLTLDDAGGFFEGIFSGIDRGIRDLFGAPPPPPVR